MSPERPPTDRPGRPRRPPPLVTEVLLLPDGRLLMHNVTPTFAALVQALNPGDDALARRARAAAPPRARRQIPRRAKP